MPDSTTRTRRVADGRLGNDNRLRCLQCRLQPPPPRQVVPVQPAVRLHVCTPELEAAAWVPLENTHANVSARWLWEL